jgi:hypothetical protein
LLFAFISCKKIETENQTNSPDAKTTLARLAAAGCKSIPIIDSMPAVNTDGDSTELSTLLGNQRTNPYTISNMTRAYSNLGLAGTPVNVTNLYVRFLPNNAAQLGILDSTLDAQGLELFDTPMDYDILREGDYYQDPSVPDSSVTWQYAVVPPAFQFPSGITYQVLSQIHIPGDAYTAVETEGERLASIQDSINCSGGGTSLVQPNVPDCGPDYHWDFTLNQCVCNCCPPGYQWNGTQCVPVQPPPPPPPAVDAQVPAGTITVSDVNLPATPRPPVRNVRIVAKRWFKIERTYTDNNGRFQFTKRFKHKVKINVKFKNSFCNIRGIRGIRIWQTLFPVKNTIGVYGSNKSTIAFNYARFINSTSARGNRYWVAATTINAVQEQRDYAVQYGFSSPPLGLNIYLTNWGIAEGLASTPLFGKRFISNLPSSYINTMLVGLVANRIPLIGPYLAFFAQVTRARLDIAIDYHRGDINGFTSDWVKETVYHEMCHASHYTKTGNSWYTNFVNAELAEIANHPSGNLNPYGNGTTSNSPIIALGEGWAYHIGHFLSDQRFGVNANCQSEQTGGISYCNTGGTGHPHIDVLENYDPNLTADFFRWIPKGLMEDLMDNTPAEFPANDQVFGFSIQQIFAALQSDINSVPAYKARFIQQNPNNQTAGVNNIFTYYHY